jgi:hypothetical protein
VSISGGSIGKGLDAPGTTELNISDGTIRSSASFCPAPGNDLQVLRPDRSPEMQPARRTEVRVPYRFSGGV